MAKTQTKRSWTRRFFSWFARHKVTAVFVLLIVGLVLNFSILWVVTRIQIHFERDRFMTTHKDIAKVSNDATSLGLNEFGDYCFYESSPIEFVKGKRLCVVRLSIVRSGIDRVDALMLTRQAATFVRKNNLNLKEATSLETRFSIATGKFMSDGIDCSFDAEYYPSSVPTYSRQPRAPATGDALLIEVICSGGARAEYFPVVDQ